MFSKGRLDTLSDGIFGVAMTLLILDVRLHVRIALWALALNFAGPMFRVWSKRATALD